jgi:hypothetical protein
LYLRRYFGQFLPKKVQIFADARRLRKIELLEAWQSGRLHRSWREALVQAHVREANVMPEPKPACRSVIEE